MAGNTEIVDYGETGLALYAVHRDRGTNNYWNGTSFNPYADGDWATYAVPMAEVGASRSYLYTVPTLPNPLPPGQYDLLMRVQAGATPAVTDGPASSGLAIWDGTTLSLGSSLTAPDVDAQLTAAHGVGPWGLNPGQIGGLRFLRNRWSITFVSGQTYRLRVYADDQATGDFSGICLVDPLLGITAFTPDLSFVP